MKNLRCPGRDNPRFRPFRTPRLHHRRDCSTHRHHAGSIGMALAGHPTKRNMCANMVACFAVGLVATRLRRAGASGRSRPEDCNFPRHTGCTPASGIQHRHRCGRAWGTHCFPIPGTVIPIFGNFHRLLPACAMVEPVAWMLRSVGETRTSA